MVPSIPGRVTLKAVLIHLGATTSRYHGSARVNLLRSPLGLISRPFCLGRNLWFHFCLWRGFPLLAACESINPSRNTRFSDGFRNSLRNGGAGLFETCSITQFQVAAYDGPAHFRPLCVFWVGAQFKLSQRTFALL